jgi:hypothetical protein
MREKENVAVKARMGRLLDFPTPRQPEELLLAGRLADVAKAPWPQPVCNATGRLSGSSSSSSSPSSSNSELRSRCSASVAVLVAGEFRDFLPPTKPRDHHWKDLQAATVWAKLYKAVVVPNGPADLFVHSWQSALAEQLLAALPAPPCATVCEEYGEHYALRVLSRYRGFRVINGFLRFNNSRETPHIVDFFYKRFAALELLVHFETVVRGYPYRAVVIARPDLLIFSKEVVLPAALRQSTIYMHNTDHHHDSTDTDTSADPIDRSQCGQMPNDWFAYGNRASMAAYLSVFPNLPTLHRSMRATKGSCDCALAERPSLSHPVTRAVTRGLCRVYSSLCPSTSPIPSPRIILPPHTDHHYTCLDVGWRCHNYRYNFTFLNNAEAYLGHHLRRSDLQCRELQDAKPPVRMALPTTRRRDWGAGWERPQIAGAPPVRMTGFSSRTRRPAGT